MNIFAKFFCALILLLFSASFSDRAYASSSGGSSSSGGATSAADFLQSSTKMDELIKEIENGEFDMNDYLNGAPIYSTVLPGSAGALACDFRRHFCGKLALIIITVSIFIVGILILMQKIKPYFGMLVIGMIVVFLHAEEFVALIMGSLELFGMNISLGWLATKTCYCTNFSF